MAPHLQDSVLAWLNTLELSDVTLQAMVIAFGKVGIEELADLSIVDEEVLEALEGELESSVAVSSEVKHVFEVLAKPGPLLAAFEEDLGPHTPFEQDRMLPFKSPCAMYFDGFDDLAFFLPEDALSDGSTAAATSEGLGMSSTESSSSIDSPSMRPMSPIDSSPPTTSIGSMASSPPTMSAASFFPFPPNVTSSSVGSPPMSSASMSSSPVPPFLFACPGVAPCPVFVCHGVAPMNAARHPDPNALASAQVLSIDALLSQDANDTSVHNGKKCRGTIRPAASNKVTGYVWNLSQDPKGSRTVQQAIEEAASNKQRESLALELKGHISAAMQCPHANHVLQKCASILEPSSLQFIIDEIAQEGPQMVCKLAQHRYACRVLEGLLMHCLPEQLFKIVGSLLADAVNLSSHRYANFVMQRLLEHRVWRQVVVRAFEENVSELARGFFGSLVLAHALRQEPREGQAQLCKAIASDSSLLMELKRFRHGPALIELALQNVAELEQTSAQC